MLYEIKNIYGAVIARQEAESLKEAMKVLAAKEADLRGAYLQGADLRGADLRGSSEDKDCPPIPVIQGIHSRLLAAIEADGCKLDMSNWHICETTHCRAGWVVQLAGEAGATLEAYLDDDTAVAAALIYRASDPDLGPLPDFYCDNETAMRDIKRRAEMEATAV